MPNTAKRSLGLLAPINLGYIQTPDALKVAPDFRGPHGRAKRRESKPKK